jgi:hypothetical protein
MSDYNVMCEAYQRISKAGWLLAGVDGLESIEQRLRELGSELLEHIQELESIEGADE